METRGCNQLEKEVAIGSENVCSFDWKDLSGNRLGGRIELETCNASQSITVVGRDHCATYNYPQMVVF